MRAVLLFLVPLLLSFPSLSARADECVNVGYDSQGEGRDVWFSVFGAVGVAASVGPLGPAAPDGASASVYAWPTECGLPPVSCKDLPEKLWGLCRIDVRPPALA